MAELPWPSVQRSFLYSKLHLVKQSECPRLSLKSRCSRRSTSCSLITLNDFDQITTSSSTTHSKNCSLKSSENGGNFRTSVLGGQSVWCSRGEFCFNVAISFHLFILTLFLLLALLQMSPLPLHLPPPHPPSLRLSPHSCLCLWVMHTCSLTNVFTFLGRVCHISEQLGNTDNG